MSLKSSAHIRSISPLVISDGFVHGWVFDPLRPVLGLSLSVDGQESATGLSGHAVADSFYAQAVPPNSHCGFSLPLPTQALDGRTHKIVVKVSDWQALLSSPKAELDWFHGPCFGEVVPGTQGFFEGWVGFRQPLSGNKIPPVLVSEGSSVRFAITLKPEPHKTIDGSRSLAKFRVSQSQFAALTNPVFSCLGNELRLRETAFRCKVVGQIEQLDHDGIRGWILNAANPAESLDLVLIIDDLPHSVARPNVRRTGIARQLKLLPEEIGICGFSLGLPSVLKDGRPHTVSIRCKADGTVLNATPLTYQHKKPGMALATAQDLLKAPLPQGKPQAGDAIQPSPRKKAPRAAPKVAVVILNRNGAACLDDLFKSLQLHNTVPLELIVIDHASTDDSLRIIRQWAQQLPIHLEALEENFSFSASCNRGARLAKAPHLLFLNNDIVWLQDALPAMLDSLKDPKVGIVGLRLLQTEFATDGKSLTQNANPEVQHLGVRFTLVGDQYWPYEVTPETADLQAQYSRQPMPVVTGAVLLCRREQFLAAGGFDEGYFYGYEDVELCLRMGRHNDAGKGLDIICRNDLVALHHHGYTRLTGREPGMIDHQVNNQKRLTDKLGLWLKRHYWQSLLDGDQLLTAETFTIGFAIAACPAASTDKSELAAALELAAMLVALHPRCRILFLTSDQDWDHVGECHVLVALSPDYDLRTIKQARADLRTALYVHAPAAVDKWRSNPGLALFDLCLYRANGEIKKAVRPLDSVVRLAAVAATAPLGDLLATERLRILVKSALPHTASALISALKAQGALVRTGNLDKPDKNDPPVPSRVIDVVITLFDRAVLEMDSRFQFEARPDAINVLWIVEAADELRPRDIAQADQVWLGCELPADLKKIARQPRRVGLAPKTMQGLVKHLLLSVDDKVGRSFYTP